VKPWVQNPEPNRKQKFCSLWYCMHKSLPPLFLSYPNLILQGFPQIRKQFINNYFP
jgi:hypothetical protein